MCQDTKDISRHTRRSEDVEELHSLHLKAVVSVDHEEDNVGNLGDVDHGLELVGTFEEGQALLLRGDDGDGPLRVGDGLFGIPSDQRLEERRLADAWRADDGNQAWRGDVGESVDEGNMEALFLDLRGRASVTSQKKSC